MSEYKELDEIIDGLKRDGDALIAERDQLRAELNTVLAERDGAVSIATQATRERDRLAEALRDLQESGREFKKALVDTGFPNTDRFRLTDVCIDAGLIWIAAMKRAHEALAQSGGEPANTELMLSDELSDLRKSNNWRQEIIEADGECILRIAEALGGVDARVLGSKGETPVESARRIRNEALARIAALRRVAEAADKFIAWVHSWWNDNDPQHVVVWDLEKALEALDALKEVKR